MSKSTSLEARSVRWSFAAAGARNEARRGLGLILCAAAAACACSTDATGSGGPGAGGSGNAGAAAGSPAMGGASGSAGAPAIAGSPSAGSGGMAAGAAGSAAGGSAGSSGSGSAGANAGAAGNGASSGAAGMAGAGTAGSAGMGGGADCAGHALSLGTNGSGSSSDGAKARVDVDLKTDLPLGNTNRTLELWAYMKDSDWTANTNTLFFYGPASSARNADGFGLDFGSKMGSIGSIDPFTNAIFDNDNQASGVTTTNAQWVHFAMTWNGTAVQAYVNGILKSSKTSSTSQKTLMTGTSVLTIGGYPSENAYFAGLIDEFRVWNVERSAAEIMATMHKTLSGSEAGLVGYFQFNESSGTSAADSVKTQGHTAHNGTLMAASAAQNPTFVLPSPASPVSCP